MREGIDDEDLSDVEPDEASRRRAAESNAKGPNSDESSKKSTATTLVEMAQELYEFGVSTLGETYALPKSGPKCVSMLRGSKTSLRNQLARVYFQKHRRAVSQQALADALLVVEGFAQEQPAQELFLRVANTGGHLWLDIGDTTGRAIKITGCRWTIEEHPPVLFRRTALNGPLPDPVPGGSFGDLWGLVNVAAEDRPLIAAWLVATLFHNIPHPVLSLFGEQGTGKTTAHKMIVSTIDPEPVPTRQPPRDSDSWVTAASGSWIVGLDNLSTVHPWLSDSICRAVTGDGDVRRKLYTDGEHVVFAFRRCICLNGIDLGATRGDLAERMLPITLDRISETDRRPEEEIWASWDQLQPRILGAILDLAASVIAALPSVELASKPRMADFAKTLKAVDGVIETNGFSYYLSKLDNLAADSLTGDCFILAVMHANKEFEGTAAKLLAELQPDRPPRTWPKSPRTVTTRLKRHSPALRKAGWIVCDDGGRNKSNALHWTLIPPEKGRNLSSLPSLTRENGSNGGEAGEASQEYEPSQDGSCEHCLGEGCRWCGDEMHRRGTVPDHYTATAEIPQ